jgi:DNA-binding NarL/FixJ family response regulator
MLSSPKILYVEDNPADADLMKQALEAQGEPFSLMVVEDGQTVLDLLRSDKPFLPDVIVLDLELRGVDGLNHPRRAQIGARLAKGADNGIRCTLRSKRDQSGDAVRRPVSGKTYGLECLAGFDPDSSGTK